MSVDDFYYMEKRVWIGDRRLTIVTSEMFWLYCDPGKEGYIGATSRDRRKFQKVMYTSALTHAEMLKSGRTDAVCAGFISSRLYASHTASMK